MATRAAPHGPILIVDDHADTRDTLAEILQDEGYQVVCFSNGQEALAYLQTHPAPCMILLDLIMPVMDGWEFRRRQRGDPSLCRIPIAILSGANQGEQQEAELDAVGYFVKPVNLPQLLQTVARYY
jgi:CheY-like chemotaxis protein